MRLVIQRVSEARVDIDGQTVGSVGRGFLVLVGISEDDSEATCDAMLRKMTALRIFEDGAGKTNLDIRTVGGSILLVSQFTLYADCRKGNRPSFVHAGSPKEAERLFQYMIGSCEATGIPTQHGIFGADMKVSLVNDGPFTIVLDSKEICPGALRQAMS